MEPGPSAEPRLFGADVDHIDTLPAVSAALRWLDSNHLNSDGLWRKAGAKKRVKKLRAEANRVGNFPVNHVQSCDDLVSALIQFIASVGGLVDAQTTKALLSAFNAGGVGATAEGIIGGLKTMMSVNRCPSPLLSVCSTSFAPV